MSQATPTLRPTPKLSSTFVPVDSWAVSHLPKSRSDPLAHIVVYLARVHVQSTCSDIQRANYCTFLRGQPVQVLRVKPLRDPGTPFVVRHIVRMDIPRQSFRRLPQDTLFFERYKGLSPQLVTILYDGVKSLNVAHTNRQEPSVARIVSQEVVSVRCTNEDDSPLIGVWTFRVLLHIILERPGDEGFDGFNLAGAETLQFSKLADGLSLDPARQVVIRLRD